MPPGHGPERVAGVLQVPEDVPPQPRVLHPRAPAGRPSVPFPAFRPPAVDGGGHVGALRVYLHLAGIPEPGQAVPQAVQHQAALRTAVDLHRRHPLVHPALRQAGPHDVHPFPYALRRPPQGRPYVDLHRHRPCPLSAFIPHGMPGSPPPA